MADSKISFDEENKKKINAQHLLDEVSYIPNIIINILSKHLKEEQIVIDAFGEKAFLLFGKVHRIQIITIAASLNVGLMAKYWLEEISGIPCQIEVAAEYINRVKVVESNKLCVILSKSGEESEALTALAIAKDVGYAAILGISNIVNSTLIQASDLFLLTNVGKVDDDTSLNPTQTFAAQLTVLFLLSIALGRYHRLNKYTENVLIRKLQALPEIIQSVLTLSKEIKDYSDVLAINDQAVYLGRDIQFPIAMEGAAKLREHAEVNAIARSPEEFLVSPFKFLKSICYHLPVIALAPSYDIFEQWKANFENFHRLNYQVLVISDKSGKNELMNTNILPMPKVDRIFSPMIYTIPMQLLAGHVAMNKVIS